MKDYLLVYRADGGCFSEATIEIVGACLVLGVGGKEEIEEISVL